jgi:hypothetical protein
MEISREQALTSLRRWQQSGTTLGLIFAARGGTAHSAMLAQISEVSSRVVFKAESSILGFSLLKVRFERRPITVLRFPHREGLTQIDGLHIWLESGHWLFICDAQGMGEKWLETASKLLEQKRPGGPTESPQGSRAAHPQAIP